MRSLFSFLLAAALPLALASNHSNDTNTTSDGMSGGAVAGIIIGVLAGLGAIGGLVYYFYFRPGASMGSNAKTPATTARQFGENHLPMVALRVNGDDDI